MNPDQSLLMLSLLAEVDLVQRNVNAGPYGTEQAFTTPSLNLVVQVARRQLATGDKESLATTALAFAFILGSKGESMAETYVSSLANDTEKPLVALLCSLLREPIVSEGLQMGGLAKALSTFGEVFA